MIGKQACIVYISIRREVIFACKSLALVLDTIIFWKYLERLIALRILLNFLDTMSITTLSVKKRTI